VTKVKLTQFEYDKINAEFQALIHKQKKLRQSHIDSVDEGDARECEAWTLTNDLSNLNYIRIKELNDLLLNSQVISTPKTTKKVKHGLYIEILMRDLSKKYLLCNPEVIEYIDNGLSIESPIGKFLLNKPIGNFVFVNEEGTKTPIQIMQISELK
jgi:transcription elongation GreA/GreB family factor